MCFAGQRHAILHEADRVGHAWGQDTAFYPDPLSVAMAEMVAGSPDKYLEKLNFRSEICISCDWRRIDLLASTKVWPCTCFSDKLKVLTGWGLPSGGKNTQPPMLQAGRGDQGLGKRQQALEPVHLPILRLPHVLGVRLGPGRRQRLPQQLPGALRVLVLPLSQVSPSVRPRLAARACQATASMFAAPGYTLVPPKEEPKHLQLPGRVPHTEISDMSPAYLRMAAVPAKGDFRCLQLPALVLAIFIP